MSRASHGRSRPVTWRWALAVLTLTLAGACLVLAVVLLALSALCDSTGLLAQSASCAREMVFQAARAGALAVPLGAVGALAMGWGSR